MSRQHMPNGQSKRCRRQGRRERKKQLRINKEIKKRLFGHLAIAPCYYCRYVFLYDQLTIEHLTPLCLGGSNEDCNIALACGPCNHQRGKVSWHQRLIQNEQHSSQYHQQNRERIIQNPQPPYLDY